MKVMLFGFLYFMIFSCNAHEYDYDLIVIGAGSAGLTAANIAHDSGMKVLLIEKNEIGGQRIWSGDIPFKALFKCSHIVDTISRVSDFGIDGRFSIEPHFSNVLEKVRNIQNNVHHIIINKFKKKPSIKIMNGNPFFINNHTIKIDQIEITSKFFIVATGGQLYIPPFIGLESVNYLCKDNFFALKELPKSLVIIGGGPLGVEMACSLNKFGIKITLVMRHKSLLPTFDFEIVELLSDIMAKSGINVICDMRANEVSEKENGVSVVCQNRAGVKQTFFAENLFLATGTIPNTENLGLQKLGIKITKWGIVTNDNLQTHVPHIYACGDVVGALTLSRVAYYHAKAAVLNMTKKTYQKPHSVDYSSAPKVIFSLPQLAVAGLTEQEAYKKFGPSIRIYRCNYDNIEKALIERVPQGMVKFICDKQGILLGVHVLGSGAGEIVDAVCIGQHFSDFALDEIRKIKISPSYFDIVQEMAYLCKKDIKKEMKDGFFTYLFKYIRASLFRDQVAIT